MSASIWGRPSAGVLVLQKAHSGHGILEESSSEVTSSSTSPNQVVINASVPVPSLISPAHSLGYSDIGDVDLEFWDLDLNAQNGARFPHLVPQRLHHSLSDTSSISG